jgi:hypothetical protein
MSHSKRPVDRRPVDFWPLVNRLLVSVILVGYKKSGILRSTHVDPKVYANAQLFQYLANLLTLLTGSLRRIIDLYICKYLKLHDHTHSLTHTFEVKRIKSQQDVFCSYGSKASITIKRSTARSTVVNRTCKVLESLTSIVDVCENRIFTNDTNNANHERTFS